jgi:putative spermidine/putrescine transport system permease protein
MRSQLKISKILLAAFSGLVFFFLVAPILIVIPVSLGSSPYLEFPPRGFSLQWYQLYLRQPKWLTATQNSIGVAFGATLLSVVLGTIASFGIVRSKGRVGSALQTFFLTPMVVPVIILAIAFYFFFAKLHIIGSIWTMILAHTVLAVPFVITNVIASLKGFDRNLEKAAMNLGANPVVTFFRITMPSIQPGIVSGALFAFITSFDEVVVAMFIGGNTLMTLPRLMFAGIRHEITPTIAAVSSMLIVISIALLLTIQILGNRRIVAKEKKQ